MHAYAIIDIQTKSVDQKDSSLKKLTERIPKNPCPSRTFKKHLDPKEVHIRIRNPWGWNLWKKNEGEFFAFYNL